MKIIGYKTNLNLNNKLITWVFAGLLLLTAIFSGIAGSNMATQINTNIALTKSDVTLADSWTYGSSEFDDGFAIANDSLGYIYLAGITKEFGTYDMILIKVDQNGNEVWTKIWDAGGVEATAGVAVDILGNIYVTGSTTYGVGIMDMFLIKYNALGIKEWNLTRGVASKSSFGHKIAFDSSLTPYIVGTHDSDIILYKYSTGGVYQWNRTWDGSGLSDHGYNIFMDDNDDIYIVGDTDTAADGRDVVILVYGSPLYDTVQTSVIWGGSDDDYGNSIWVDDGYVYAGGGTWSYGAGGQDILLLKYDSSLVVQQWYKTYGTAGLNETSNSISIYSNSIFIGGNVGVNLPADDVILLQVDKSTGIHLQNNTWDSGYSDLGDGIVFHSNGDVYMILTADYPDPTKSEIVLLRWDLGGLEEGIPGFNLEILLLTIVMILPIIIFLKKKTHYLDFK
ncbi:MAG: hypothetical protein EU548_09540 [Promethearchaeota archaeon]|nr:MAG: hypothetical protein EU548_09540 [Candidatus Lokiarchaeota archaeon]